MTNDRDDVREMLETVREFQEDYDMTEAEADALRDAANPPLIPVKPCPPQEITRHARAIAEMLNPSLPVKVSEKTTPVITCEHQIALTPRHLREYLALKEANVPDTACFSIEIFNYEYDEYEHMDIAENCPVRVTWTTMETRAS
jgi:hypothetical protein